MSTQVPLTDGPLAFEGAIDLIEQEGVRPVRLPLAQRAFVTPDLRMMASTAAGVRITLATDSASLAVEVDQIAPPPEVSRSVYDLVVDGSLVESRAVEGGGVVDPRTGGIRRGDPISLELELPGAGLRAVELWLPQIASVRVRSVRVADGARVEPVRDPRPRWVTYGSSITHCGEAHSPFRTWPAVAARLANVHLTCLGYGGACHLDQAVARLIRDRHADRISLKLGINVQNGDTMRERAFIPAVHGFLDTVRDGHPQTPITVVSPIFCPLGETSPGPLLLNDDGEGFRNFERPKELREGALHLQRMRAILEESVERRRAAGDVNLEYLDGRELFGEGDVEDLPDLLHPNGNGYERMGERFASLVLGVS